MLSIPADHRGRQLLHCVLADIETLASMSGVPDESASNELLGYRCFGVRYRPADRLGRWLASQSAGHSRGHGSPEAQGQRWEKFTGKKADRVPGGGAA